MAIYRTGPLAGSISGAIGGVVFVEAKGSKVVRHRPVKLHQRGPFVKRSRAFLSNVVRHWATMTSLQRDAWNTAAGNINSTNRLGQASPMLGFNYFVKTNTVAFPGARAIVEVPQTLTARDLAINPAAAFDVVTGFDVQIDNPDSPSFLQIQVYGWPSWVDHHPFAATRLVFLDERSASADPVQDNIRPEWIDHFGDMVAGQRFTVGIKARASASPFNPMTIIQGIVTA